MASFISALPAPRHTAIDEDDDEDFFAMQAARGGAPPPPRKKIPAYGARAGFIPRSNEDFGEGGAYPEVHVAQYPLNMGRKDDSNARSSRVQTLALTTDATGKVRHDAVVKQQHGTGTLVQSSHSDLLSKTFTEEQLMKPSEEEVAAKADETRSALEALLQGKTGGGKVESQGVGSRNEQFIRYTPSNTNANMNSGASQRIISIVVRMVDAPRDLLEPPKFMHKKVPNAAGDAPVPVLHSPPRKLTPQDHDDWKIPPCISQWKNTKGYTIPLHMRLAADGRGAQTVEINDKFAHFNESLSIAQEAAREAITARAREREAAARREKEVHEERLRLKAQEARLGRAGFTVDEAPVAAVGVGGGAGRGGFDSIAAGGSGGGGGRSGGGAEEDSPIKEPTPEKETKEEREERRKRDDLRYDRRKEREREWRLEELERKGVKKSKITRDKDRDISERIALGLAAPTVQADTMYDSRLFNQTGGLDQGFGAEDSYTVYDKAMGKGGGTAHMFKPTARTDGDAYGKEDLNEVLAKARFKVDSGFKGADGAGVSSSGGKPVQFEREKEGDKDDVFGISAFFQEAKKGGSGNALDGIGAGGGMGFGAGGGGVASNRSKIDFEKGKK